MSLESRLEQCEKSRTLKLCCFSFKANEFVAQRDGNCLKACHQSEDADFMDSTTIRRRQRVSEVMNTSVESHSYSLVAPN